jgi:hypothetical protein
MVWACIGPKPAADMAHCWLPSLAHLNFAFRADTGPDIMARYWPINGKNIISENSSTGTASVHVWQLRAICGPNLQFLLLLCSLFGPFLAQTWKYDQKM